MPNPIITFGSTTHGTWAASSAAPVGSSGSPGYNSHPVAKWDFPTGMDISTNTLVGVWAFHYNGIDRVEIQANEGTVLTISNPINEQWTDDSYNSNLATQSADGGLYIFEIDPMQISASGMAEFRATVYPRNHGQVRILQDVAGAVFPDTGHFLGNNSLHLHINRGDVTFSTCYVDPAASGGGTVDDSNDPAGSIFEAARTIADAQGGNSAGGGTIFLNVAGNYDHAGTYTAGDRVLTDYLWVTVTPRAGLTKSDCTINARSTGEGLATTHVRFLDMSFADGAYIIPEGTPLGNDPRIFLDDCLLQGVNSQDGSEPIRHTNWEGGTLARDTTFQSFLRATRHLHWAKRCTQDDSAGDTWYNSRCIIYCTSSNMVNLDETHNDIFQFFQTETTRENILVVGLTAVDNCSGQPIFWRSQAGLSPDQEVHDVAIVNCLVHNTDNNGQLQIKMFHWLFYHNTYVSLNQRFTFNADDSGTPAYEVTAEDMHVVGNIWEDMRYAITSPGNETNVTFSNNQALQSSSHTKGDDFQIGPGDYSLFVNEPNDDYTPANGSAVLNRVNRFINTDHFGNPRGDTTACGAVRGLAEPASTNQITVGSTAPAAWATTATPAPVGMSGDPGYDGTVICRWSVVPYQTFSATFAVGVEAYHYNGIDRVEFSVNNGPWLTVSQPVKDLWDGDPTNVTSFDTVAAKNGEYVATIDPTDFDTDTYAEVRARVYPQTAGQCRVLQAGTTGDEQNNNPMCFTADQGGLEQLERYISPTGNDSTGDGSSGNPWQTIAGAAVGIVADSATGVLDGATIYMQAGTYQWADRSGSVGGDATERWLTITAASGVDRGDVVINTNSGGTAGNQGLDVSLIKLGVLTVTREGLSDQTVINGVESGPLYMEGTRFRGWDPTGDITSNLADWPQTRIIEQSGGFETFYAYDVDFDWIAQHLRGGIRLERNCRITDTAGDVFTGLWGLAKDIDITRAYRVQDGGSTAHGDVFAASTGVPPTSDHNIIISCIRARNINFQIGILGAPSDVLGNIAFVNWWADQGNIDHQPNDSGSGQNFIANSGMLNFLWYHLSWGTDTDHHTRLRLSNDASANYDSSSIIGCIFSGIINRDRWNVGADMIADHNHVLQGGLLGTDMTINENDGPPNYVDDSVDDYSITDGGVLNDRVDQMLVAHDCEGTQRTLQLTAVGAYAAPAEAPGAPAPEEVGGLDYLGAQTMVVVGI